MFGDDEDVDKQEVIEERLVQEAASLTTYEPMSSSEKDILLGYRPETFMKFNEGTELALALFVERHCRNTNAMMVQRAIDVFCYSRHWMMHMGDLKLPIVRAAVATAKVNNTKHRPGKGLVVVELGSYCGYSAVALSQMLQLRSRGERDGTEDRLVTFEVNAKVGEISERIFSAAGLHDKVEAHCVAAGQGPRYMKSMSDGTLEQGSVGMLFLDHEKKAYPVDLETWMASGLLAKECVVVADNVAFFAEPDMAYLGFARSVALTSEFHPSLIEYTCASNDVTDSGHDKGIRDAMEVTVLP